MKKLIIINGTMRVGKTVTCTELQKMLSENIFLDGDWCWNMTPFVVTDETKAMAIDNITYLLNNFLSCSKFENIIFGWVIHQEEIMQNILSRLRLENCSLHKFSLICSERALARRIKQDIKKGKREPDVLARSLGRLKYYKDMDTQKIDTSNITATQAAQQIFNVLTGIN